MTIVGDFTNINRCLEYSKNKIAEMVKQLEHYESVGISVVLNGSFARHEASEESDVDFFVLAPQHLDEKTAQSIAEEVKATLTDIVGKPPSAGGSFGVVERLGSFAKTIGGQDDDNPSITRRILFLTEGKAVVGADLFNSEREALVSKYIRPSISDHQLGLFLLNDIIRYYRTICVDFEHKTAQQGKPWGIRNIKLVFSRKLLYFGGILVCAETALRTHREKISDAIRLMSMTPIERLRSICGSSAGRALEEYDYFLGEMMKPDVRAQLADTPEDKRGHPEIFKMLKNRGHRFSMCLMSALDATYPPSHPIHRSLIM